MDDVEITGSVIIDTEGLCGTPEQNRNLVLEEEKIYRSTIDFMFSLKRINDAGLYTARGFKDMRSYMREFLGNKIPFALSFAQGLLQLSHKAEDNEEIRALDSSKLKSLVNLSRSSEIVSVKGTIVTLEDGTTISAEEYENRVAKRIIEKADKGIKESKKVLQEKLEETEKQKGNLEKDLENERKRVEKLESEKERTAKLIGLHGDRLSRLVNLTNAMSYLNTDCKTVESDVLEMVLNINSIGEELRSNPEIVEEVGRVFAVLRTACRRIINSWSPYNVELFSMAGLSSLDKLEEQNSTKQIEDRKDSEESLPAVKLSSTQIVIYLKSIIECLLSIQKGMDVDSSKEEMERHIISLSEGVRPELYAEILAAINDERDIEVMISNLNTIIAELEAIV